jgi:hypothetical protein
LGMRAKEAKTRDGGRHVLEGHHGAALQPEVGDEPSVGGIDLRGLIGIVVAEQRDGRTGAAGARTGPCARDQGQAEDRGSRGSEQNSPAGLARDPELLHA